MDIEIVKQLKENQETLSDLFEQMDLKKKVFEKENEILINTIQNTEERIGTMKETLKESAIDEFNDTGSKRLLGGIGIRVMNKISYDDIVAIDWVKINMPIAIKEVLDKKQFETFAKNNDLEFVEKTETPIVTFPKEIII